MATRPVVTVRRAPSGATIAEEVGPSAAERRQRRWRQARLWAARGALPVALLLWVISLQDVSLTGMRDLGLLQVLPPLFWVSLALLALGFCLVLGGRRPGIGWPLAYVLGLIAMLHATPQLLYPTMRYGWAWKHVAVIDAMIRNDGAVPNADKMDIYNQWPGFFQLNAVFVEGAGLDSALGYAAWTPPVLNALLLGPLLLLYRTVTRNRRLLWGAVWIFFSCSWVGQDYFAPQAFAFLLFVAIVALVLRQASPTRATAEGATTAAGRPAEGPGWRPWPLAAVLVLVAAVVTSHPLTPLLLAFAMAVLSIRRSSRRAALPVLTGSLVFTALWFATVARPYIAENMASFLDALTQPDTNVASGLAGLGPAAPGQVLLSWVDRGLSAAVFLLAALAFLRRGWTRHTALPLLVVAPLPLLVLNSYGGEMIFRVYLFALPAAALLIAALILPTGRWRRPRAVGVALVLLSLLGGLVFGYYGKEAVNQFTHDEVAAARFVTDTAPPASRVVSLTSDVPGLDRQYDLHWRIELNQQDADVRRRVVRDPVEGLAPFVEGATAGSPAFVVLSKSQAEECYLTGTLPADTMRRVEAALQRSPDYRAVYRNTDAVVFRYQDETPKGAR